MNPNNPDNSRAALLLSSFFGTLAIIILSEALVVYWDVLPKAALVLFAMIIGVSIGLIVGLWLCELASRWNHS